MSRPRKLTPAPFFIELDEGLFIDAASLPAAARKELGIKLQHPKPYRYHKRKRKRKNTKTK